VGGICTAKWNGERKECNRCSPSELADRRTVRGVRRRDLWREKTQQDREWRDTQRIGDVDRGLMRQP
jgi:hypothetical protein